tara:strand:+ start:23 stop:442 length:420 start_codon:yes stop_codon:yes gene_type:complete
MRPQLEFMPKVIVGLLCIWLSVVAILPLFGYNIIAAELMAFEHFKPQRESYYLYVVRSATFMMLAFFGLNYLRRRRPLSSVAPLLVYVNFVILFGVLYQLLSFSFVLKHWLAVGFHFPVSFWLYQQNRRESKTIFTNDW